MKKKIEWIALNQRSGDLKGCSTANYFDYGYLRQVVTGVRDNENMLDTTIMYIRSVAPIRKQEIIEVEGMTVGLPQVLEPKAA